MRVLFTNAGRRTYLVEFALDLPGVELFVSDCDPLTPAFHVSPDVNRLLLPRALADRPAYAAALRKAIADNRIEVVFPLSDLDIDLLADMKGELAADGTVAVVATPDMVRMCMDKRRSYEFCRQVGLPFPRSWFRVGDFPGRYPCIRKHIQGSGGSGFAVVERPSQLDDFVEGRDMLQPLLQGTEYGLDILNDLDGRCRAITVKRKITMRAGETDRAEVIEDAALDALGRRIASVVGHVGNLDVDVLVETDGTMHCLDFNPRFGGGYPATYLAGRDYLAAILAMVAGSEPVLPERPRRVAVLKGISLYAVPL